VGDSHLIRRQSRRFLLGAGLPAIAVVLLHFLPAGGEEFIKKALITPGDPKPIHLNADNVCTWTEGSYRIFLLHGTAWIEQGLIKISMPDAVVWVDEAKKKSSGIYYLTVYGEGGVGLREGANQSAAGRVLIDLATRGEVRIKARADQVLQKSLPNNAVYRRGLAEKQASQAPAAQSKADVTPASGTTPALPAANAWSPPSPGPAGSTPPALPSDSGGQPPQIQRVSWLTSDPGPASAGPRAIPGPSASAPAAPPAIPPPVSILQASAPPPGLPPAATPGNVQAPATPGALSVSVPATINSGVPSTVVAQAQVPTAPVPSVPGAAPGVITPPAAPPAQMPVPTKPSEPGPPRKISIRPRSSQEIKFDSPGRGPDGETAVILSNGVIISITNPGDRMGIVDMEADRVVIWTKGESSGVISNMTGPGETKRSRETEFYLAGHVQIYNKNKQETHVLYADEVYYDVGRNVAIALRANMEIHQPRLPYPLNIQSEQIVQQNPKLFETGRTVLFASNLASDPGLTITVSSATVEDTDTPRRNIFGFVIKDLITGEPMTQTQKIFRGRNMILAIEGVPIFYLPFVQTDPEDPLGPLDSIAFNYNKIFGFQFFTTWNVYDLIGVRPVPGTRWQLDVDYLTARGPALGTNYQYAGRDMFFGIPGRYEGMVKAYGIDDGHKDVLGGNRGIEQFVSPPGELGTANFQALPIHHPELRGRFTDLFNVQDIPGGFFFQGQIQALSDKNFLEQFFNYEYNSNPIQQTFLYGGWREGNLAVTGLAEDRIRDWVTETNSLPRLDAFLIGQKFFDLFTYTAHGSAGYYQFLPTHVPPPAYFPTDVNRVNPFRVDLWQDVSVPFSLGALKLAPYAVFDPTYYSDDVNKDDILRLYGGGGIRASFPLSRLYPGVQSDFFNLNGIYHKMVFSTNYYNVFSNYGLNSLPQLDRLNDDATDQALRNLAGGIQYQLNPANSFNLVNNPLFNPQFYALRRLLDNTPDSLQSIEVVQLDWRQRLQTKRGFPGNEHVVDWMILDLGMTVFPRPDRDNFGETVGIMQYDWTWNIGDSTSLVSNGWMDPIAGGPHVFNVGGNLMRPDRTNLYLGYRQIDPLNSKAIIANITYALNAKYFIVGSTIYDFGVHTQVNSIALTRVGTDMQISLGFSYNSILNTVGVNFVIVPNLFAANLMRQSMMMGQPGTSGVGGMGGGMGSMTGSR
jgi:hypothetical protein